MFGAEVVSVWGADAVGCAIPRCFPTAAAAAVGPPPAAGTGGTLTPPASRNTASAMLMRRLVPDLGPGEPLWLGCKFLRIVGGDNR